MIDLYIYFLLALLFYNILNKINPNIENLKYNKDYCLIVGYKGVIKKKPIIVDMRITPHLLVCGLSGSGKTKCIEYAIKDKRVIILNAFKNDFKSIKCPKINGKNCAFCYKNNGGDVANCMTLSQFKELIDFMPKNLSQIAFGITGVKTNPEFFEMMQYAKDVGIVSNYTTNGVDLDDACIEKTLDLCGRIAVSCYEGAKEICYDTMKRVGEAASKRNKKFPCNIHLVLSKATYSHVKDVLNDAKDRKIPNLGAIVILRIKPVGRASKLDCVIPKDYYREIVDFCLKNNIKFGFDSCGAKAVEEVLVETGNQKLVDCIESGESSRLSSYFNWKREYWSCSFCENNHSIMNAIDPFAFEDFSSFWNCDEVKKLRFPKEMACKSCPWYCLD